MPQCVIRAVGVAVILACATTHLGVQPKQKVDSGSLPLPTVRNDDCPADFGILTANRAL